MPGAELETTSVAYSRDDNTVVVHVRGEIDVATAPVLEKALRVVIEEQGNLSVRLDLSDMTFIDTTGLSVMARAHQDLAAKGGEISLANPKTSVLKVFEIVGLTQFFEITPAPAGGAASPGPAGSG